MMKSLTLALWAGACLVGEWWSNAAEARPALAPRVLPGQQADGSVMLPNQWSLRPVGRQVVLGDFPVNIAVHPGSQFAAVLHCGYGQHEIVVVDIDRARVVSQASIDEAFYGLTFDAAGQRLYCSGAGDEVIHSFGFRDGYLTDHQEIRLRPATERGVPAGLALSPDGRRLWAANVWGHQLSEVLWGAAPAPTVVNHPLAGSLVWETGGRDLAPIPNLPKPPTDPDLAAASKRTAALRDPTQPTDPFPYACVEDGPRQRLYVTLWAQARVAVADLVQRRIVALWSTEEHPNELVLDPAGRALFVANANRNTVTVIDPASGGTLETLSTALYPDSPPGSTPNSLAVSPDRSLLFVANACNNTVAVFDVSKPGASRSVGVIPVGWYPTSVRVTPDGKHLLVANGKGIISKSNRLGPQPDKRNPPGSVTEYIGGLFRGTLSIIDLPVQDKFLTRLKAYTTKAYRCSPLPSDVVPNPTRSRDNPIPARLGAASPIKYCLYILKENRTYDQVLGDLPQGKGDPSLCLFGEEVTPNHHQLARDFVLLDNFYVESEVSADGHEWSMAAYATDFVEKTWPMNYGHDARGKYPYPSEGNFPIAAPASGYLWDRARAQGVSFRVYGEFLRNGKTPADPATTTLPALEGNFDPAFRGWDLEYADLKRADHFIAELRQFEQLGRMPSLQILRLPNDHTYGTSAGKLTPRAMVADNDLALGRLIEALTRSKFWPKMAVFIVEDDAQNGPDHVDAHRTIAYAISPFVRRGTVDSTLYSTCSMLRTLELILGLKPMTQFDAAAAPMFNAFQARADLRPYRARPARIDLAERNSSLAWGSDLSATMDFSKADAADDLLLNQVIWHSIRGPDSPMPSPVRAAFVFSRPDADDD